MTPRSTPTRSWTLALLLTLFLLGNFKAHAQYCDAGSLTDCTDAFSEYISNVTLNGVSNASACSGYADYSASDTFSVITCTPYTIDVENGYIDGYDLDRVKVWVDLNNDSDFDDAGEFIGVQQGTGPYSIALYLPNSVAAGTYRMRIRMDYDDATANPCDFTSYGEVEDYALTVSEGTGCLPPPLNDDCAGAIMLIQGTTCNYQTFHNFLATGSAQPACTGTADDDVWFSFVATTADPVISVLGSSSFDPVFEVLDSCNGSSLACIDNTTAGQEETTHLSGLTIGNTYYIRVYDYYAGAPATDSFQICVAAPSEYCQPVVNICDEFISNVEWNGTTNPTGCTTGGYIDYSNSVTFTADAGTCQTMVVSVGAPSYQFDNISVFVDWDHNFDFTGPNETLYANLITGGFGPGVTSVNPVSFYVPGNVAPGDYRMRIRLNYNGGLGDPCANSTFGEVEDYTLTVVAGSACIGAGAVVTDAVGMSSVNLHWAPSPTAVSYNVRYKLASDSDGVASWASPLSVTDTVLALTGLDTCGAYQIEIQTVCAGGDTSAYACTFPFHTACCIDPAVVTNHVEAEGCGDDTNGGCNMGVPTYESVACNDTVSGTAWWDGSNRDTDWFLFHADQDTNLVVTLTAAFPGQVWLYDATLGCFSTALATSPSAGECQTATIGLNVPAGDYWIEAAPQFTTQTYPCGSGRNNYFLTVNCLPLVPPPANDSCGGAIAVACGDTVSGATQYATDDANSVFCGTTPSAPGVWYTLVGDGSIVTASLCGGATWDTKLNVYSGSCGNLICVTGNDDACNGQSKVSFVSAVDTTYFIFVNGYNGATGSFTMSVTCEPLPVNDSCQNAIAVSCGDTVTGYTVGATLDENAPVCGFNDNAPGVWYTLVGTGDVAIVSVCNADYFDKVSVYSGTCNSFTCMSTADNCVATFATQPDSIYHILVNGFFGAVGHFTMTVTCMPPPPNDSCQNGIAIACGDTLAGSTLAATSDNVPVCNFFTPAPGVWYTLVGNGQIVTLNACDADYSSKVDVFKGSCGSLECVNPTDACSMSFVAQQDSVYHVLVSGLFGGTGNFTLTVQCDTLNLGPCNAAVAIACGDTVSGTTVGATTDLSLTQCGTMPQAPGVWYTLVGDGNFVTLSLCNGTDYDSKLNVYTGVCGNLSCVTGDDDSQCGTPSVVNFPTIAGTVYYIYVNGYSTNVGNFTMTVSCTPPPANDSCQNAIAVACGDTITGSTVGASLDENAPTCGFDANAPGVWYTFVGTGDLLSVNVCNSDYNSKVNVYAGSCDNFVCSTTTDNCSATFLTQPDSVYHILVNGFFGSVGNFTMTVACIPPSTNDNVCNAVALTSGVNGPFSLLGATVESGEPLAPGGDCEGDSSWCSFADAITNTLWFTFVAPASGHVSINSPDFDTQLAVWDADSCQGVLDSAVVLVGANDDDPDFSQHGGQQYSSYLELSCLVPGRTYYVQLDVFSESTSNWTTTVKFNDLGTPDAGFTGLNASYCVNATAVTLTPNTPGGTFSGPGVTDNTFDPTAVGLGGPYTIVYTLNTCTADTQTTSVTQLTLTTAVTQPDCSGGSNGAIDVTVVGGVPPYSYTWSNFSADEDLFDIPAGTYTVTVSDASGCSGIDTVVLASSAPQLAATVSDVQTCTSNDGAIDLTIVGGVAPYTVSWSSGQTTASLANLLAGAYAVTVTDAAGCSVTNQYVVNAPSPIDVMVMEDAGVSCSNDVTGAITAMGMNGTAPYTFVWSNNQTTATATGLSAGTYTVTVTDANGCSAVSTYTLNSASPAIVLSESHLNAGCGLAGSIDLTATGGVPPFTFAWSGPASGQNPTGLEPGTYTVTVTDANGCSASLSIDIANGSGNLDVTLSPTGPVTSCYMAYGVTLTASPIDNVIYIFTRDMPGPGAAWVQYDDGNTFEPNTAGAHTYSVIAYDTTTGCVDTSNAVSVNLVALPEAAITAGTCLNNTVVLTASPTDASYTYQWLKNGEQVGGANVSTYTATTAGLYRVVITDSCGVSHVSDEVAFDAACFTGFEDIALNEQGAGLNTYPNPNDGNFTIETYVYQGGNEEIQMQVVNMLGQVVYAQPLQLVDGYAKADVAIDRVFADGMYSVRLVSKQGTAAANIVVTRP